MSRRAATIVLTKDERTTLEAWSRGRSIPARLVQRAKIIGMADEGRLNQDIAAEVGTSRPTVQLWRQRFLAAGRTGEGCTPARTALVLCLDEKTQIQALDRTQPGLPMKPGRGGTFTHDHKRHGTTTLFAALNVLDGKVIGDVCPAIVIRNSSGF